MSAETSLEVLGMLDYGPIGAVFYTYKSGKMKVSSYIKTKTARQLSSHQPNSLHSVFCRTMEQWWVATQLLEKQNSMKKTQILSYCKERSTNFQGWAVRTAQASRTLGSVIIFQEQSSKPKFKPLNHHWSWYLSDNQRETAAGRSILMMLQPQPSQSGSLRESFVQYRAMEQGKCCKHKMSTVVKCLQIPNASNNSLPQSERSWILYRGDGSWAWNFKKVTWTHEQMHKYQTGKLPLVQ